MNTPEGYLADARELLAKYDELELPARLQSGEIMLAEVRARAGLATATALVELADVFREAATDHNAQEEAR